MRNSSLAVFGIKSRFTREPVVIDYDAIGEGLVAYVGVKGSGKTSLLECPGVSLFGQFPTRPSFYDQFQGCDAYIESTWDARLKARIQVNAEKRTTERYLFLDGEPLTDGKSASFEREVAARFGSYELFLASPFAAQDKAGNFLAAKKSERKKLFAELLALHRLEADAEASKLRRASAETQLAAARSALDAAEREAAGLEDAEQVLATAAADVEAATGKLETARIEETAAQGALARARSAAQRTAALVDAERSARATVTELERAADAAKKLPAQASGRAGERAKAVKDRKTDRLEPDARGRHSSAVRTLDAREASLAEALASVPDLETERGKLETANASIARAEELAEAEGRARAASDDALLEAEKDQRDVTAAQQAREAALGWLAGQAARLGEAPCTRQRAWITGSEGIAGADARLVDLAGTCPLLADAREAKAKHADLLARPVNTADADAKLAGAREFLEAFEALRDPLRAAALKSHRADRDAAASAIARAEASVFLRKQRGELPAERKQFDDQLARDLADAQTKMKEAADDLAQIERDREQESWTADETIRVSQEKLAAAAARHGAAQLALVEAQEKAGDAEKAEADLKKCAADRAHAERTLRSCDQVAAAATAKVEHFRSKRDSLVSLREVLESAERELGDWLLLERSCGKDGAQALEIDAAGPEVAAITNDLLIGTPFSIAFETLREKRDGGWSEVFDINVFDGGLPRTVETLSGGEKVVVGEGVGLGIATHHSRKSGRQWGTIWRDETAGALDPDSAIQYCQMLRRARAAAGAFQVIFIAHQELVWREADAQIYVADGRVSLEEARRAA